MKEYIDMNQTLADIGDYICEGYYWMSDQNRPEVLLGSQLKEHTQAWESKLPFIVEGNFYCREKDLSIMYKHVDGKPVLRVVDLSQIKSPLKKNQAYKGISVEEQKLNFNMCEIWEEVEDTENLMEGILNLQPLMSVFAGFNPKKNA